ncbi:MAG: cytochrome-c oxidase, cbb3-type subunit III [Gammaproteobacteria bacterium]|nr:cytochrome-c oxidase, cbb3-type subunit III [Gammaproteobacteria bacterium]
MGSFSEGFWNLFIFVCTVGGILGLFFFIRAYTSGRAPAPGGQVETTGHKWDGDLEELNNPLPRWWLNLFYITLVFGVVYLLLYPGVGSHGMLLGWTQKQQYEQEMAAAEERYGPIFDRYLSQPVADVAADQEAIRIGRRLFVNYCATCHGSDAGGNPGFPSLRDAEWLYGGSPDAIKTSILAGRSGIMPPWSAALGPEGVTNVAQYVLSLGGRATDQAAAAAGEAKYRELCVACHGTDGKGNHELGAPDLTNDIWLYGGSLADIETSIASGRQGRMPAHEEFLGEAKSHLLAAYVYSLTK